MEFAEAVTQATNALEAHPTAEEEATKAVKEFAAIASSENRVEALGVALQPILCSLS